ncbi:MAG: hypothetical protein U0414_17265 [Polyangiaceae bacterium]
MGPSSSFLRTVFGLGVASALLACDPSETTGSGGSTTSMATVSTSGSSSSGSVAPDVGEGNVAGLDWQVASASFSGADGGETLLVLSDDPSFCEHISGRPALLKGGAHFATFRLYCLGTSCSGGPDVEGMYTWMQLITAGGSSGLHWDGGTWTFGACPSPLGESQSSGLNFGAGTLAITSLSADVIEGNGMGLVMSSKPSAALNYGGPPSIPIDVSFRAVRCAAIDQYRWLVSESFGTILYHCD